jgi:hypothetical protein
MSTSLSSDQFGRYSKSISKEGAMPRSTKFDDIQLDKSNTTDNQFAPNKSQPLAKPGFF